MRLVILDVTLLVNHLIVAKKITSSADRMSTELSLGWISLDETP